MDISRHMSVYLIRGQRGELSKSTDDSDDVLFIDQRFEDQEIRGVRFSQCTFANVSFKNSKLIDCHFSGCVFEGCYFRGAKLSECHFPASRFIECEFTKASVYACGFGTTRFQRTAPRFSILEASLPGEANLRRDVCQNIASEASALGFERDARRYRLASIRANEQALWRGFLWADEYSESHYPGFERLTALGGYLFSRLNGILWGHGEYIRRLLGNLAIVITFGAILLLLLKEHLEGPSSFWDCLALSVASVLNNSGAVETTPSGSAIVVVLALSASGLLFLGLFVTYVFRAVTRH